MHFIRLLFTGLLIAASAGALCAPRVLVSIKPVHALAAAVMDGAGEPALLIEGARSPHDFRLTPSSARHIQGADLFIWVGPDLENKLARPVASLAGAGKVMTLQELPLPARLPSRRAGVWKQEEPDHDAHDGHGHAVDPHVWLDPDNAVAIVNAMAGKLAETDTANAGLYSDNARRAADEIATIDRRLKQRLSPVAQTPFITLHDNLQYFEEHYGLQAAGTLAADEHHTPGARRVVRLREMLKTSAVNCIFHEPQIGAKQLELLAEDTGARTATVDPLGTTVPAGAQAYTALLEKLADDIAGCLEGAGSM